jgi:hypothetical protein
MSNQNKQITLKYEYKQNISNLYLALSINIKNINKSNKDENIKQTLINNLINKYYNDLKVINQLFNKNLYNTQAVTENEVSELTNLEDSNKKACLIGLNYIGTANELFGCINDVNSIKERIEKNGFNNIKSLTDLSNIKPTYNTILEEFTNLLVNSKEGDLLLFFYSGHGSNTLDNNNDETDGRDEMIIPTDFKPILDDELKQIIQTNLKANVTLLAMFDACFSGTVLDLKYQYLDSLNYDNYTENSTTLETEGNVIMISGCSDIQTSVDSKFNGRANGAMTWALLDILNNNTNEIISWRELIKSMRDLLKSNGFEQLPQLSSGKPIDIDSTVFI